MYSSVEATILIKAHLFPISITQLSVHYHLRDIRGGEEEEEK